MCRNFVRSIASKCLIKLNIWGLSMIKKLARCNFFVILRIHEYLGKNKVGMVLEDEAKMVDGSVRDGKERQLVREESAVKPFSRIRSERSFTQHHQVHYLPAQNVLYKPQSSQVVPIQRVFSPTNATQRPLPFQIPAPTANIGPMYRV